MPHSGSLEYIKNQNKTNKPIKTEKSHQGQRALDIWMKNKNKKRDIGDGRDGQRKKAAQDRESERDGDVSGRGGTILSVAHV